MLEWGPCLGAICASSREAAERSAVPVAQSVDTLRHQATNFIGAVGKRRRDHSPHTNHKNSRTTGASNSSSDISSSSFCRGRGAVAVVSPFLPDWETMLTVTGSSQGKRPKT